MSIYRARLRKHVASYGALGHVLPFDFQQFLCHFGVNLTANYPTIV